MTDEINKRLEEMATDLETKARLTKAEKLLLQAKGLIERQTRVNRNLNFLLGEREKKVAALKSQITELERRLDLIPRWVQRVFNAD